MKYRVTIAPFNFETQKPESPIVSRIMSRQQYDGFIKKYVLKSGNYVLHKIEKFKEEQVFH